MASPFGGLNNASTPLLCPAGLLRCSAAVLLLLQCCSSSGGGSSSGSGGGGGGVGAGGVGVGGVGVGGRWSQGWEIRDISPHPPN